jgi:hypothetical protein
VLVGGEMTPRPLQLGRAIVTAGGEVAPATVQRDRQAGIALAGDIGD